jgi:signal peptidase I
VDRLAIVVRRLPPAPAPRTGADGHPGAANRFPRWRRILRRLGRIGLNLVFAAMMATVAIMLVPAALGFHRYVILTGSMTGTYDRGSIVYDHPVAVSELKVGDPITYAPPPGFTHQQRETHRIYAIGRGADGQRVFRTKGDANKSPDVWNFLLPQRTQDRVVFHVPYLGYAFMLLSLRTFRMVLVGVPAVILGLFMVLRLWRDAGQEARRRKLAEAGWQQVTDAQTEAPLPPILTPAETLRRIRVEISLPRPRRAPEAPPRTAEQRARLQAGSPLGIAHVGSASGRPLPPYRQVARPVSRPTATFAGAASCAQRVRSLRRTPGRRHDRASC